MSAFLAQPQRIRARRALSEATGTGERWTDDGPLSLLARAEGVTQAELERWDTVANGDGPLTVKRIQESGNAFQGWPLAFLEALDGAWKASCGDADKTLAALDGWLGSPHTETAMSDGTYDGPERRSSPPASTMFTFSIQHAIAFGTLLAMLAGGLGYVIRMNESIMANTAAIRANGDKDEERYRELRTVADEFLRTKLTYCLNSKADSTRRAPDAGC